MRAGDKIDATDRTERISLFASLLFPTFHRTNCNCDREIEKRMKHDTNSSPTRYSLVVQQGSEVSPRFGFTNIGRITAEQCTAF